MNKVYKFKKPYRVAIMAWILVVAMLFPTLIAFASQQTTGKYEDAVSGVPNFASGSNGESYYNLIKNELPLTAMGQPSPKSITISLSGKSTIMYLNIWLWVKKQLLVYGDYTKVPSNNFMCGTAPRNDNGTPVITENAGFYKVSLNSVVCLRHGRNCSHKNSDNTIRGEWEYHGYDVNGNKYSNQPYIGQGEQVNMNQLTLKDWVKNPWDVKWKEKYPNKYAPISGFNEYAIRRDVQNEYTREWIARSMIPMSEDEDNPMVYSVDGTFPDVYNYLNVMQNPTKHNSGSGRMYHKSLNDGKLYYYTFNIPVIKVKGILETETDIPVITLPKNVPLDSKYADIEQVITVNVRATYKDEEHRHSEPEKQEYYTREDLVSWNISANIKELGITLSEPKLRHLNTNNNYIETQFTFKVKNSDLNKLRDSKGNITITSIASAKPTLYQNVPGYVASASKTGTISDNTDKGSVTVFYKVKNGELLAKEQIDDLPFGKYTYKARTFTNCTLIGDSEQTITLTEKNSTQVVTFEYEKPPIKTITIPTLEIRNDIGEIAFDGIPFTDVSDSTDMSKVTDRRVYVNGVRVNDSEFFRGNYIFNATTDKNGYFAKVDVEYKIDTDNIQSSGYTQEELSVIKSGIPSTYKSTGYVYVYPTKPNASFKLSSNSFKQNRIITATDTSVQSNIALVMDRYPLKTTSDAYRWTLDGAIVGDGSTDISKILMYKDVGSYSITLQVQNVLGKWSDPYTVEFQVLEDYKPNIEVNLNESVITRNDAMTAFHYDINSTDGDKIQSSTIELWHDSDGDEVVDKKIKEWNGLGDNGICEMSDFPSYAPTKLGLYKYIITAKEEFVGVAGQETIASKVTDADKKTNSYEVDFWVENYVPLSDLYIDAPIVRPNVDMLVMLDKNLADSKRTSIMDSRVNMENTLLKENIIPSVRTWDMKTYVYEQGASTTVNTGTSFPPDTTSYSSNGYSGTLNRTSYSDNGGLVDFGTWKSEVKTRPYYTSFIGYVTWTYTYNGSSWNSDSTGTNIEGSFPQTVTDPDGYTGTAYYYYDGAGASYGGSAPSNPKKGDSYSVTTPHYAHASGTLYKTETYWVPNMQWVSNYYGYYSGTIYKYVRQLYTDPWRSSSSKYILYVSDGNINELADFNATIAKADAKIILAGTPSIQDQCTRESLFIDITGKTTEQILQEALAFVSRETPDIENIYILQGQSFNLNVGEMDLDGDNIIDKEFQYVHDSAFFDNPTGIEPGTQPIYSETTGWTTAIKNSFNNVGKYFIYRRVKDLPDDPLGDKYAAYSGSTRVDVIVHRKPIALATLDWDFNSASNNYKTTWVDKSYDLDHQYSDANKGITERKIMWQKNGGEWNYTIPDNLSSGTYRLNYYVKDIEGVWSDPWVYNFTLAASPPMQFEAKLRSEDIKFRNPPNPVTLPASENLQPYDLWTRYPTNPTLTMAIYDSSSNLASPIKTINYSTETAMKIDNDINWYPASYTIPAILKDGNYIFKISATGSTTTPTVPPQTTTQSKEVQFPVTVLTPINLKANINGSSADALITTGQKALFTISTSKYVNITQIQFEGITYTSSAGQIKQLSQGSSYTGEGVQSDSKTWALEVDISATVYTSDKNGVAYFKALLPSGKEENISVNYSIKTIMADNFNITSILDIGWRDFYFDTSKKVDINGDGISNEYIKRMNTSIGTSSMPINYYGLIGYSKRFVKAGYKIKGSIKILGNPDSASFRINYFSGGKKCSEVVPLHQQAQVPYSAEGTQTQGGGTHASTDENASTYTFEWIVPLDTDRRSFVAFDLVMKRGGITYGNERWLDNWDYRNTEKNVLYIDGSALDDLSFVQEQ